VTDTTSVYAGRIATAAAAVELVKPGEHVFLGTGCATPLSLVAALEARRPSPPDVELFHFLTSGLAEAGAPYETRFRHRAFFVGSDMSPLVRSGAAEYVPISLVQIPELIANGRIRADVAMVQVTPPDKHGWVSLGVSVDVVMAILRVAATIIAEVNPRMPRTHGDTLIPVERIARFVPVEREVTEYRHPPIDDIAEQVARYVAEIIEDGATLQIDLGRIPNEALKHLKRRRNLGIHSNVITEGVLDLIKTGVITGAQKTLHPGRVVASFSRDSVRSARSRPLTIRWAVGVQCGRNDVARALRGEGRLWNVSGGGLWNTRVSMVFIIVTVYALSKCRRRDRK